MKDTVLFYHARCSDGFGAAYAFWCKFKEEIEYIPLEHSDRGDLNLEDYRNKMVYMADISLERDALIRLNEIAKKLVVLDHHKSAQEELGDLEFCTFDMNKSGAVMAWEYLFTEPVPYLLKCIEDRDLWRWEVNYSKQIVLYCDSYEMTFENWDAIRMDVEDYMVETVNVGFSLERLTQRLVERIKNTVFEMEIKGYRVPTINSSLFKSEALASLAEGAPFSAGYHFDGEYYRFSLRSSKTGIDTSKIATMFPEGGGHFHASGFSIKSLEELK